MSSADDVILVTSDATEGQKDKLHTVSLANTDLGPILLQCQQYSPSFSLSPSPSRTQLASQNKVHFRGMQQGFLH